jgi:hypothetical protein
MSRNLKEEANIRDYLLGLDDLKKPKIIDMSIIAPKQWNSAILMISRLIMMKKGTYPDHPDLGIDIRGRYSFSFEDDIYTLQEDIDEQANRYLPEFAPYNIQCMFQSINDINYVVIVIIINNVAYTLLYNIDGHTLEGLEEM